MKNPFSCISCSKTDNNTTTFTIKSSCFNKPIKISILNDDKKYEMIHQLIWALAGDEEKKQLSQSLLVPATSPEVAPVRGDATPLDPQQFLADSV